MEQLCVPFVEGSHTNEKKFGVGVKMLKKVNVHFCYKYTFYNKIPDVSILDSCHTNFIILSVYWKRTVQFGFWYC